MGITGGRTMKTGVRSLGLMVAFLIGWSGVMGIPNEGYAQKRLPQKGKEQTNQALRLQMTGEIVATIAGRKVFQQKMNNMKPSQVVSVGSGEIQGAIFSFPFFEEKYEHAFQSKSTDSRWKFNLFKNTPKKIDVGTKIQLSGLRGLIPVGHCEPDPSKKVRCASIRNQRVTIDNLLRLFRNKAIFSRYNKEITDKIGGISGNVLRNPNVDKFTIEGITVQDSQPTANSVLFTYIHYVWRPTFFSVSCGGWQCRGVSEERQSSGDYRLISQFTVVVVRAENLMEYWSNNEEIEKTIYKRILDKDLYTK